MLYLISKNPIQSPKNHPNFYIQVTFIKYFQHKLHIIIIHEISNFINILIYSVQLQKLLKDSAES